MPFFFPKGNFRRQKTAKTRKTKTTKKTTVPSRILPRQNDAERQESLRPARCSVVSPPFGFSLFPIIIFVFLCAVWRFSSCVFIFVRVSSPRVCLCVCVCSNGNHYRRQQERKKKQQLSSRLSNDSPRALAPVLGLLRPGSEKQRQQPAQCIGLIVYIYDYYNLILNTRSTTCLMFQFNKKPNKEPATCDEITNAQKKHA